MRSAMKAVSDFTLSGELDRWDSQGIKFIFGMDAHPKVVQLAESLSESTWKPLERMARYEIATVRFWEPQKWHNSKAGPALDTILFRFWYLCWNLTNDVSHHGYAK